MVRGPREGRTVDEKLSEAPGAAVRFGCSSFSSDDWVGPFYPPGTRPADYLRHYARQFDTVEIDATYYAIPRASVVDGWFDKTPEGFLISAKFPRSMVHAGKGAVPDGSRILVPEETYHERDEFLRVMQRLGGRLGPLVLQFPYFSKKVFASEKPFMDRLDQFLGDLPGDFDYAVEVRNRQWLSPELAYLLRSHRVSLVLVDQAWMPHADEVLDRFDPVTGPLCYVRLLGDRKEIEAITDTWGEEVIDRRERLDRWVGVLHRMVERQVPTLVYVNNHYAGHAPATVRRLQESFAARQSGEA
jgi:uncharacterized protein YecE (DUF72 family)